MNIPTLNIESIGCISGIAKNEVKVFYIPSLTYIFRKWFTNSEKTIYIPLLFENETQIVDLFKHYDNIRFRFVFANYVEKHYSKWHYISEILNFTQVFNIEYDQCNKNYNKFYIDYIFDYKGHKINIRTDDGYYTGNEYYFVIEPTTALNIFNAIEFNLDKKLLKYIQEDYTILPHCKDFVLYGDRAFTKINDMIKYVDKIVESEIEYNNKLESYYSKKSFKLIEA